MRREKDGLPTGQDILNQFWPEAKWDVSGLFDFDDSFTNLCNVCLQRACVVPIESVHGCYPLMWNSGRAQQVEEGKEYFPVPILTKWMSNNVGCYLTFSNHLIEEKHTHDAGCNWLLGILEYARKETNGTAGIILSSEVLSKYIRSKYPELKQKASIVKIAVERPSKRSFEYYDDLSKRFDRVMVTPDDNFELPLLEKLAKNAEKYEILVNENCVKDCSVRHCHYDEIGGRAVGTYRRTYKPDEDFQEFELGDDRCGRVNYFNKDPKIRTERRNCNLTTLELKQIYDMGFRHFKIQGRGESVRYIYADFMRYVFEQDHIQPILKYVDPVDDPATNNKGDATVPRQVR